MNNQVTFDEDTEDAKIERKTSTVKEGFIIRFLLSKGIAKTTSQANKILLVTALLFIIATGVVYYVTTPSFHSVPAYETSTNSVGF